MLLSIGDLVLDIAIVPERRLRPDDDTPSRITVGGGGQAANFCAWAAYMGEGSRLVTRVGDDESGRRLVAELEASGVKVFAVVGSDPTGAVAVLIGPGGERTMATQRGASIGLRPQDLRPEWFADVDLIHVPAYSLFIEPLASAARAAVERVRAAGGLLAVDLSSAAGLRELGPARMVTDLRCLAPDLLFATAAEAEAVDVPPESLARVAVLKLGPSGCSIGVERIEAPEAEVVDPTGAGDAFAAAFCAAYVHGASSLEAGKQAVLVASKAVSQMGARPR